MLAAKLYQRGVAVSVVENAFVLAAARRLMRPADAPPLGTIRSLAYFLPVMLEAAGEGTKMADHFSPKVRPAFPSSVIISERSSPSRVRCAAPNNGAPLTACGPFQDNTLRGGKGSRQTARWAGDHFAAILVPFFSATDMHAAQDRAVGPLAGCESPVQEGVRRTLDQLCKQI